MEKGNQVIVVTGSDAFILTGNSEKKLDGLDPSGTELKLTITLHWEEYREPAQPVGSLWLEYLLGKTTQSLPGIEAVVPIVTQGPECETFVVATPGNVRIHYTGQANAHVWLSYFAERLAK